MSAEPPAAPTTSAHDRDVRPDPLQDSRGLGHPRTPLADEVQAALAGLDDADAASHADAFEAVDAAILAELRRLESL